MRFKAEIFDNFQYLYQITGFSDHQLHCVIQFENRLNAAAMEMAVRILVKTVPVLSRVYKRHNGNSYWEDVDTLQWADLFTIADNKDDFDRFTFSRTNEEIGPQIKVCLLQSDSDSLSIIINHMIADGAGIKQCASLLSDIYSNLLKDPGYMPDYIIDGDRSFKRILSGYRFFDKMKILLLNNKDNNQDSHHKFPMSTGEKASPFILVHEMPPEIYHGLLNFSKKHNATVNDVILTAYFRVLSNILNLNGETLGIPIMVDMRRYLKDKSFNALANLSSTVIINIAVSPASKGGQSAQSTTGSGCMDEQSTQSMISSGEDFLQTLIKVRTEMNAKKSNYLGLSTFLKLDTLFGICGRKTGYQILKKSLKNPYICMTNIGVLDSAKLIFEGSPISNAYICGSIKYRPHFQMSLSSFKDKMTFCVNLYGSSQDRDNFSKFFTLMDHELESISDSPQA